MKRLSLLRFCIALCLFLSAWAAPAYAADLPVFKTGFVFTTHHTPFLVAASQGERFKSWGVYLRPVAERQSYELVADGKAIALLDLVVSKSGSETATLFAQKHLDMGLASITAIMAGIDKGVPMRIVCPLQTEGMSLLAPKESTLTDWESFATLIRHAQEPVKVGFHSPTSAPKIVLEGALKQAGFAVTMNPADMDAQVLFVDLKDTSNLLSALSSKQVDVVVGPSPFPEVAVNKGVGKVLVHLGDLPPAGQWKNFPCCVGVVSQEVIEQHPEVAKAFVTLMLRANNWSNAHRAEAGTIAAQWIGLPAEAGRMSSLVFLNDFTESWLHGAGAYLDILNSMNKFTGALKDKSIDEAQSLLIDDSFLKHLDS